MSSQCGVTARIHLLRIGSPPPDQRIRGESGSSVASKKKTTGKKNASRVKEAAKKAADKAKNRAKKDADKAKKQAKKAAEKAKSAAKKAKKTAGKAKVAAKNAAKKHGKRAKDFAEVAAPVPAAAPAGDTIVALRARARELGIPNYSRLTKAQLAEQISAGR